MIVTVLILFFGVFSISPLSNEATVAQAINCDWPMFRGDPAHTGVANPGCFKNISTFELEWETSINNRIKSSLAVAKDKIFFGSSDDRLHCIETNNGKELWSFLTKDSVATTPLLIGDNVYFGSLDGFFYCVSLSSGNLRWKFNTLGTVSSSPNYYEGMVYAFDMLSKILFCINADNGEEIWQKRLNSSLVFSSPAIYKDKIYLVQKNFFLCLNAKTGLEEWRFTVEEGADSSSSPVLYDNKLYFGSNDNLYSLDPITGKLIWSYKTSSRICSAPIVLGNAIFYSADNGLIACYDFIQKKLVWKLETSITDRSFLAYNISSPCLIGEILVAGSLDRNVYFIDSKSGKVQLKYKAHNEIWSSPAIYNEKIFIASLDGTVYCFGVKSTKQVANKLILTPENAKIYVGESLTFTSKIYDVNNNLIEGAIIYSLDNIELASIDSNGILRGNNIGFVKVKACYENICAYATVEIISHKKPALITCMPSSIDFDVMKIGESKQISITVSNIGDEAADLSIDGQCDWVELSSTKVHISEKSQIAIDIKAVIKNDEREIGKRSCLIKLTWNNDKILISVNVLVELNETNCILKVIPSELFFGKINRGKSMILPMSIILERSVTSGRIISSNPWIEVSPRDFISKGKTVEGTVTIKASALPAGESFEGFITVNVGDECQEVKIPVYVKTDKNIVLDLVLGNKNAQLNGENVELDVPPQSIKGRTLVPIRFISESFGCKVEWEASSGKITISRHDFVIVLWKDKTKAIVNGKDATLDVPASIVSGRTLVPVRFISEAFGAKVDWEAATKRIVINWDPI